MKTTGSKTSLPTIFVASDHAGFDLKERLKTLLPDLNWVDLGPTDASRVDYPDYADRVAQKVVQGKGQGLLICGSGQGMAMRANKHRGVRAALVWDEESARLSREHNDANILCLGSRRLSPEMAVKLTQVFLETSFEGGRHAQRIDKLKRPATDEC